MIPVAIILAIVLSGALGILLMYRQAAAVAAHREHVPDGFAGWISAEEHQRAAAYTLARTRLAIAETIFGHRPRGALAFCLARFALRVGGAIHGSWYFPHCRRRRGVRAG